MSSLRIESIECIPVTVPIEAPILTCYGSLGSYPRVIIKIVAEMAIAAGTRRIEAVAGQAAFEFIAHEEAALKAVNARLGSGAHDVQQKLESVLNHQKEL